MSPKHFLDIAALDRKTLRAIIDDALALKAKRAKGRSKPADKGQGPVLAMIFEQPSTRTRVSFEVAMLELGGRSITLNRNDMQWGRGEALSDTARVLSRYVDAIMLRAGPHPTLLELAEHATVPVINGLTSRSHPCQVMADVMTFEELKGPIKGRTIAWVGDANNVATSWVHAAARFGCKLRMACPAAFAPAPDLIAWARDEDTDIEIGTDPTATVQGADCVVTDVWVSMGDGDEKVRKASLRAFQVNAALMARAKPDAIFMHCLPAHRGDEVTSEIIDGPQSAVWDEAENRLHVQKAILSWCLDPKARAAKHGKGAVRKRHKEKRGSAKA
jgi:ornithine carbamoyltransferase